MGEAGGKGGKGGACVVCAAVLVNVAVERVFGT